MIYNFIIGKCSFFIKLYFLLCLAIIFFCDNSYSAEVIKKCNYFTDIKYSNLYNLRLKHSSFQNHSLKFLVEFVKRKFSKHKSYSFLSVGPGNGNIELNILNVAIDWMKISLIEPNEKYFFALNRKFGKINNVTIIKEKYESYLINYNYDFILMNQIVHLLNNPVIEIKKSLNYLNNNGSLIIIIHSDHGMHYFRNKYSNQYHVLNSTSIITGEGLSHELKDHHIAHKIYIIDCNININICSFNNVNCSDLISFIFLRDFKKCQQYNIIKTIRKNFLLLNNFRYGHFLLNEPMVIMSLTKA